MRKFPIRRELEGRGEIPHVSTRTDSLGREQPVKPAAPVNVNTDTGEIEAAPALAWVARDLRLA